MSSVQQPMCQGLHGEPNPFGYNILGYLGDARANFPPTEL